MKGVFAHWPNRITAIRFIGALILFAVLESLSEESLSSIDSAGGCATLFANFSGTMLPSDSPGALADGLRRLAFPPASSHNSFM